MTGEAAGAVLDRGGAPGFDAHGAMSPNAARAATFLKTLAHEGRLEVLCQLIDGEKTVSEIEAALAMRQSSVSQLLMRLRSEGLVEARRDGRNVHYRLGRPEVRIVITALREAFCP